MGDDCESRLESMPATSIDMREPTARRRRELPAAAAVLVDADIAPVVASPESKSEAERKEPRRESLGVSCPRDVSATQARTTAATSTTSVTVSMARVREASHQTHNVRYVRCV
jgi:hypothetical protein